MARTPRRPSPDRRARPAVRLARETTAPTSRASVPPRARFRRLDQYRVDREWARLEGTPQRDLFRQLRVRFLQRHRATGGPVLEIGPGPGRFTRFLGEPGVERVLLDLSAEMLRGARAHREPDTEPRSPTLWVQGDGLRPPFRPAAFPLVSALGNSIGFAEDLAESFLDSVASLVAPGGTVIVETVAGFGERSRYLHRLPGGAIGRLFRSPGALIRRRVEREGFHPEPEPRRADGGFRRMGEPGVRAALARYRISILEVMAVAPALGGDPDRIAAVHASPGAWPNLLQVEEELGREPGRWAPAAALLIAGLREGTTAEPTPRSRPASGGQIRTVPSD